MSKPGSKTISWIIYPPKYRPGDGYLKAKTLVAAKKQAAKLGVGSTIYRTVVRCKVEFTSYEGVTYWCSYQGH